MNILLSTFISLGTGKITLQDVIFLTIIVVLLGLVGFFSFAYRAKAKMNITETLDLVILRVRVPKEVMNEEEKRQDLKNMLGGVEPFFANTWSIYKNYSNFEKFFGKTVPTISMEIISQNEQIFFYFTVGKKHRNFLERQIHSVWSDAFVEEVIEDHKIFDSEGFVECAEIVTEKSSLFPIKTYKNLEYDPLNSITTSISKMKGTESAAIQILIQPVSSKDWRDSARAKIKAIQKGEDGKKE